MYLINTCVHIYFSPASPSLISDQTTTPSSDPPIEPAGSTRTSHGKHRTHHEPGTTIDKYGNATAIRTEQVRNVATNICREQLEELHAVLNGYASREERLKALQEYTLPTEAKIFVELTKRREKEHILFMNHLSHIITPLEENGCHHDWSKDDLCMFALSTFFDGKCASPEAIKLKDDEIERHYKLEAHHPEWENYNDGECCEADIIEMAVDRLARCVQFGDGTVCMNNMMKYLPKFPKGNQQVKLDIFMKGCEQYKIIVEKEFCTLFPGVKYWK